MQVKDAICFLKGTSLVFPMLDLANSHIVVAARGGIRKREGGLP